MGDLIANPQDFYRVYTDQDGNKRFKLNHQRHMHETVRTSEFKAVSGGSETITTADSGNIEFRLVNSEIRGPIRRVRAYIPHQSTLADTEVGTRAIKDLTYTIGGKVIFPLWNEYNIHFDNIALLSDNEFYQLNGTSLTPTYTADTLTADTDFPLFSDITGPIRSLALVPAAFNDDFRVRFKICASGDWMDASLGTITTASSSIKVIVEWFDDGNLSEHQEAYDEGVDMTFFAPLNISNITLSGTSVKSRAPFGISEGHLSAFLVVYNTDASADKNDSTVYSAMTSYMVVDAQGRRIFSDSNTAVTAAEHKFIQSQQFGHTTSLDRSNILVIPTGCHRVLRSYTQGELHGVWRIDDDQAGITFTSADANSDVLIVSVYAVHRVTFENNHAQYVKVVRL